MFRISGTLKSISKVRDLQEGYALLILNLEDDPTPYYGVDKQGDLLPLIGQYITIATRPDIINGNQETYICELISRSTEYATPSVEGLQQVVIPKGMNVTADLENIPLGDTRVNEQVPITRVEIGASPKAKWYDVYVLDKNSKEHSIRQFVTEHDEAYTAQLNALIGQTVFATIQSTQYGLQTTSFTPTGNAIAQSPGVSVALNVIRDHIKDNEALQMYWDTNDLTNIFTKFVFNEPGGIVIDIALKLLVLDNYKNLLAVDDMEYNLLMERIVCSYAKYTYTEDVYSPVILNVMRAQKIPALKADHLFLEFISDNRKVNSTIGKLFNISDAIDNQVKFMWDCRLGRSNVNEL